MAKGILDGVRILEFSRYISVSHAGRILASQGAEVIHVESSKQPDAERLDPDGKWDGVRYIRLGALKLNVDVDVHLSEGQMIIKELLKISDVFMTNFSNQALKRFGLEYTAVRAVNPNIIMVQTPAMGTDGPYQDFVGVGMTMQGISGLVHITGFPDSTPIATNLAFPDCLTGTNVALATAAALDYRRRTGKGQFVEVNMFESSISCLETAVLDYTVNGHSRQRAGNRHIFASPHGAYRCKGQDRWCVVAVFTDREWEDFCKVLSNPPWTRDAKFSTLAARLEHCDELDRLVEAWTVSLNPEEVMEKMQEANVAGGYVMKASDLVADRHLKERNYWLQARHPSLGTYPVAKVPIGFSETPCQFGPAATIGQHNDYIYGSLLAKTKGAIESLKKAGVLA